MKPSTKKLIKSSRIAKRRVRGTTRWCPVYALSKPPAGAPRNKRTGKVLKPKHGKSPQLMDGCFIKKSDAEKRVRSRLGRRG